MFFIWKNLLLVRLKLHCNANFIALFIGIVVLFMEKFLLNELLKSDDIAQFINNFYQLK